MHSPSVLALFDLDHTLLDGDSNEEWLGFLLERGIVGEEVRRRQAAFFADYKAGRLDMGAYLHFQVGLLVGRDPAELEAWREAYARERLAPRISRAARELVARHQAAGHLVAVVSATHAFLAEASTRLLGVEHLVATRPERIDGRFTGEIPEPWSFQDGKIACAENWLASLGLGFEDFATSYFHSDSFNDLPLMELVTRPVAVNPDPRLARLAHARGWPCISLTVRAAA